MESGGIRITQREIHRYHVLKMVLDGRLTLKEAAELLGVSYRQAKRLKLDAVEGISGLVHGNRGKEPWNKTSKDVRTQVLALSESTYSNFNDCHFTEMLEKREGLVLSDETVRGLRRAEGIKPKQKRRPAKHRSRRPRKTQEGLMMLWDGSPHHWFGKEHPPCCAMASIDDATGKVLALFFVEYECSWGYFELLRRVLRDYGIPASVYQDRHSALKRNDEFWSIEEELAGRRDPTQVGAALEALGIEAITALSPQAKGRVERLFRTLQDRLVAMLGLEEITGINQANAYIESIFVDEFNLLFAQAPSQTQSGWRKVPRNLDVEKTLSFRYDSTVANDNALRFGGMVIDIPPGPAKKSYAGARAEVRQMLDGSWRVYHQDKLIAHAPASPVSEPIRARHRRKGVRAAHDSRWIYMASAPSKAPDTHITTAATAKGSVRRANPGGVIGATKIA
jgi:transposase